MDNIIRFKDSSTSHIFLPDNFGKKYIKTQDSTSKSGHSLVAQIEMTHAGIVTENYGFYLPSNMKSGASSFNKDYNKPVLVGHDADTDPVGRVISSRYVDSMAEIAMNDKYLSTFTNFHDKKSKKQTNQLTDFVQYVISEYAFSDKYRGLGHILGTFKISDEETIAKILDERYLTVSTAMVSDAARCSECGQDWISEGFCEHERGKTYDSGIPVVLIPGSQTYSHVGIVSEPADPLAAGFRGIEIIKDNISKELDIVDKEFSDKFSLAANLFSYENSSLISLSDETKTNLIEVKDNIQEIENSLKMENVNMKKFTDEIEATISLWKTSEEEGMTSVRISKYVKELGCEELAELSKKAMAALDSKEFESEVTFKDALEAFIDAEIPAEETEEEGKTKDSKDEDGKTLDSKEAEENKTEIKDENAEVDEVTLTDTVLGEINEIEDANLTKKEAKELAKLIVRSQRGDTLAKLTLDATDKELKDSLVEYKELQDKRFKLASVSEEEVLDKINELLEDENKISKEDFAVLTAKDCAGTRKYFPITNDKVANAALEVLGKSIASDSLKGRILRNIEKIETTFEAELEDNAKTDGENFDTSSSECDNLIELSDEKLLKDLQGLMKQADDRDILSDIFVDHLTEKDQEIEILEQQLELANDEVSKLEGTLSEFKDKMKTSLAEQVVDSKIAKGWIAKENREEELTEHLKRSDDSLKDLAQDLDKMTESTDGNQEVQTENLEQIENPVLQDSASTVNEQMEETPDATFTDEAVKEKRSVERKKKYNMLKATSGRKYADQWLAKQTIN